MPRLVVPLVTGELYHIFNRGVDKRVVFQDKHDYLRFYATLHSFNDLEPVTNYRLAAAREKSPVKPLVAVLAYNLLPNHYHLLCRQLVDGGISEYMKRINGGYTSYFNEKYERSGSLFQGVFKRVHVQSEEQCHYLFNYINENETVHGYNKATEIYQSSSLHYSKERVSKVISENFVANYDTKQAQKLAMEIYERRLNSKTLLE